MFGGYDDPIEPEKVEVKQVFELGYITGLQAALEILNRGGDAGDLLTGLKDFIRTHEGRFPESSEFITMLPLLVDAHLGELEDKKETPDE